MPNTWVMFSRTIVTLPQIAGRPCLLVTVSKVYPRAGHEDPDGE